MLRSVYREALKDRTYRNPVLTEEVLKTYCTLDLPSIFYIVSFGVCCVKDNRADNHLRGERCDCFI